MVKEITKKICGKTYKLFKTIKFKTSYGTAGSSGYNAILITDDKTHNIGHFKNIREFIKDRKSMCKR